VTSTIELARHLRLRVVAEGIETDAVLKSITDLGCDAGQGYFISKPLPADELTARLTTPLGGGPAELRSISARGPSSSPTDEVRTLPQPARSTPFWSASSRAR
jgi:predicted signal transduction protein with EAL and GGDEF domain